MYDVKKLAQYVFTFFIMLNLLPGIFNLKAQSNTNNTSSREVKNLTAFAKCYGYVRFFYPNTQTKGFNWDAFLVYGINKVRKLESDDALKSQLSSLFSSIAPHAIINTNENTALNVRAISQGDSISFWQHSSFSMNENEGVTSSGNDIKILVTTVADSNKVIKANSPLLKDKVQFEFIAYSNFNRYFHPENFRSREVNYDYVLDKQPNTSLPFTSKLTTNLWITMPIVLHTQEANHDEHKTEIETFSKELYKFYADKETMYQKDDIWYADFILTWNAIHHLYPYRKRSEMTFSFSSSEQLIKGLDIISNTTEKRSSAFSATRNYVSLFHDPHASISRYRDPNMKSQNSNTPRRVRSWLPFYRLYSNGKVYVMKSFDPKIKTGDEILEINSEEVPILIKRKMVLEVGSPHQKKFGAVNTIGSLFNATKGLVKLKRSNSILTVEVNTVPGKDYFKEYRNPFDHKAFEYPLPNTIYLNPFLLSSGDLNKKLDELLKAEYLIVDLRAYPKSLRGLFERLPISNGFLKSLILSNPLIMYPNQEQTYHIWESSLTVLKKPYINAKIMVLIGSSMSSTTISRGETFSSYFKSAGATLIGDSNSVGASGGLIWFTTPGNIKILLTSHYTVRQNGEEMQSVGITPDILVKHTLKGIKEGKDQIYEAALKRIRQE